MQTPATVTERRTDWISVDWQETDRIVANLRQRIFRATAEGDLKKVRSLQKLMLRTRANALVSVRRVTQQNAGKWTPGVDGVIITTPKGRGRLVDLLLTKEPWQSKPVRRVYIPKANGKVRPLGIPVIRDRCLQAMVKNALEPHWEAQFEGASYGFRPGRGCHDAIAKIHHFANSKGVKKWIVDADIKRAFDNIDHAYLTKTIGNFPARKLIQSWLKAGVMEITGFTETNEGTPQGGVISPLLANIALHGMEEALEIRRYKDGSLRNNVKRGMVRYADDFVIFSETKADAEQVIDTLKEWLAIRGLELSEEKTRIVHITEGFDFLGFTIKQYVSHTKNGYTLLITPSRKSEQAIRDRLRKEWLSLRGKNVKAVIKRLNPIVRGWANYFRRNSATKTFRALDRFMNRREVRYCKRTHPTKPVKWWKQRYFGRFRLDRDDYSTFGDKQTGMHLRKFAWHPIEYHILVPGRNSPDDPKLRHYWVDRQKAKVTDLIPSEQKLAKRQKGRCGLCGTSLFNGEALEKDHIVPKSRGGKAEYHNSQLTHHHCNQQKGNKEQGGSKAEKSAT